MDAAIETERRVADGVAALAAWAAALSWAAVPERIRARAALVLADDLAAMVAARDEPELIAFLDGLAENPATEAPLWNGDWPAYRDDMNNAVNAVITGDQSIEDFEANICAQLNEYFDN